MMALHAWTAATLTLLLGVSGANEPRESAPERIGPVEAMVAPPLTLVRVGTAQRFEIRVFDASGALRPEALSELRQALVDRKHRVDHPIHWRLATLLVAVAAHFPGRELHVVSGYRHHNRHHTQSRHTRGHAIDFRIPGVPNRTLFDLVERSFAGVGVGYYPNSAFIHLDVRPQDTLWVDYSGPGQTPCYSRAPRADLRSGRAEQLSYEEARAAGCRPA